MLDHNWQRPNRCDNSGPNCVEVKRSGEEVQIRDSKLGDASPVLTVSTATWERFLTEIREHEYEWPRSGDSASEELVTSAVGGGTQLFVQPSGWRTAALNFDEQEWRAFMESVRSGQFDV